MSSVTSSGIPDQNQDPAKAYVLDMPYTWGFFDYQSPVLLSYVAGRAGFAVPDLQGAFTYCDLGCGNGVTVNMLAACFPNATFWGIDFNPEHIENARQSAARSGLTNVHFSDLSFGDAVDLELPGFDFITMHGIYSWVNGAVRNQIHAFLKKHAGPRCLVYLCYNAMPGAAKLIPLWKIMQDQGSGSGRDIAETVPEGLSVLQEVANLNGKFFRDNKSAVKRIDRMAKRDLSYLIHEFGNAAFEPQFFSDTVADFSRLDFQFAGSAEPENNTLANRVSRRFRPLLEQSKSPNEKEALISFIRNESFRWDVYVRGERNPETGPLDQMVVGKASFEGRPTGKHDVGRRKIDLDRTKYQSLLDRFQGAGQSVSGGIGSLDEPVQTEALQTLDDLIAAQCLKPVARPYSSESYDPERPYRLRDAINRDHVNARLFPDGRVYLASPVLGSARRFNFLNGLCVKAIDDSANGDGSPANILCRLAQQHPENRHLVKALAGQAPDITWADAALHRFKKDEMPRLVAEMVFKSAE